MLEQGVPVENVRGVMGWVSDRMVETYSHTRLAAKQEALGVIEKVGSTDGGAPAGKLALPEKPVEEATAERSEQTPTSQGQVPNEHHRLSGN